MNSLLFKILLISFPGVYKISLLYEAAALEKKTGRGHQNHDRYAVNSNLKVQKKVQKPHQTGSKLAVVLSYNKFFLSA